MVDKAYLSCVLFVQETKSVMGLFDGNKFQGVNFFYISIFMSFWSLIKEEEWIMSNQF